MFDVLVVGGGYGGTLCAVLAAQRGLSVALLERNSNLGKKVRQTGNGRCNLSHLSISPQNFHGENPSFVNEALKNAGVDVLVTQWEKWGLPITHLEDGRMYPHSYQAKTVQDAMERMVDTAGVTVFKDTYIKHVANEDHFVATTFDNRTLFGKTLVLATGGKSMKQTGSDGSGYTLAKQFGHRISPLFPGICALELEGEDFKPLNGVKIPTSVLLTIDGEEIRRDYGDVLFTQYGISGPPILQHSRHVNDALRKKQSPMLYVNLLHETWGPDDVERYLMRSTLSLAEALQTFLHEKIVPVFLKKEGYSEVESFREMNRNKRKELLHRLEFWPWKPNGSKPFGESQVTCGGVDTREVSSLTMESKFVEGLYFIGEILDVDGDCGGYNLHWAFASAWACAHAL